MGYRRGTKRPTYSRLHAHAKARRLLGRAKRLGRRLARRRR